MQKMSTEPRRGKPAAQLALSGPTMGTRWSALAHANPALDRHVLEGALAEACQRVDLQMSTWKPDSDLMRLNRLAVGAWMSIPDELAYVLALGEGVRQRSGGLFDMAVLGAVQAAGFGPPARPEGAAGGERSTGPALEIDMGGLRARRLEPVALDLSGIAKGFAVDLMARTMEDFGVGDYLVSIDGEVQAGGFRGDGRPWAVALEAPVADRRDIAARLEVHNASLATSGSYRHRRLVGERWISHTIDPRSGVPVDSDLVSVTVQMPDCILADAWATALLVAGRERSEEMCRAEGLSALLIAQAGEELQMTGCGAFAR